MNTDSLLLAQFNANLANSTEWTMTPSLPAEVVYSILDHLWGDPWTLYNCALTCRTWRDASRRLLKRWDGLQIFDFDNFDRVSRLVTFRKTRHFYSDLGRLYITDDKNRPFVHVLPLRLPGSLFPNVKLLRLSHVDWTRRRPHSMVFDRVAAFTSVIDLSVFNGRFGSSIDLHKFITGFRNVVALELDDVRIISGAACGLKYWDRTHALQSPVKWLRLHALRLNDEMPSYRPGSEQPFFCNPLLVLCTTFTSITILHIRRCTFRMLDDVYRMIQSFPRLQDVKIVDVHCRVLSSYHFAVPQSGASVTPALEAFVAHVESINEGNGLLEWLASSQPLRSLRTLSVSPCSPSLVGRTLRAIGRNVNTLSLETRATEGVAAGKMKFAFVSGADLLHLWINLQRDVPSLLCSCFAALQGLGELEKLGRAIRQIRLHFNSESRTQFGTNLQVAASVSDAVVAERITSRPVFAAVERVTVDLASYPLMKATNSTTLQAARDQIRGLLSVWDLHGLLHFLYPRWYSTNPDIGQPTEDNLDSGLKDDTDDWDIWKEE